MTILPTHYPLINRLCAEKVMGWTTEPFSGGDCWNTRPTGIAVCILKDYWEPCTSLVYAAALTDKVLRMMFAEHGGMVDVTIRWSPYDNSWYASFSTSSSQGWMRHAPTEPLARTLACLAAVGVDVEKELNK